MTNEANYLSYLTLEERAEVESGLVDLALERFFDNVIEVLAIKTQDFTTNSI